MDSVDLTQILSAGGSMVFAVWAAFHLISKTIPQLLDRHAAEREAMLTRYEATLDKITDHCKEELRTIVAMQQAKP